VNESVAAVVNTMLLKDCSELVEAALLSQAQLWLCSGHGSGSGSGSSSGSGSGSGSSSSGSELSLRDLLSATPELAAARAALSAEKAAIEKLLQNLDV
jgi:hypothetical protein